MARLDAIHAEPDGDAALVAAARSGERSALDALLRRHHDRLHGLCRRVTGNDADAADATQEALMAIVRGLHRFDGRSSFATWSHRVAVNAALDEMRRRARRPLAVVDAPANGATHALIPDRAGDPAAAVAARLDVEAALRRLPLDFRVAVTLRDLSGLSYVEIAEVLDVPIGTVRSRIARGRDALATDLATDLAPTGPRAEHAGPQGTAP